MTKVTRSTAGAIELHRRLNKVEKRRGAFTKEQAELHEQAHEMLDRGVKIDKVEAWVRKVVANG